MPTQVEKELSDRIAREFAAELRQRLGDHIQKIILYGSRARGDFGEWSDFDVIAIVDHRTKEVDDLVLDLEGEFLDRYDTLICTLTREAAEWNQWQGYPFSVLVEEEGIAL